MNIKKSFSSEPNLSAHPLNDLYVLKWHYFNTNKKI